MANIDDIIRTLDELLRPTDFQDLGPNGLQVPGANEVTRVLTGVSATLESVTAGRQHSTQWSCAPDYSPYHVQLYPDATSHFTVRVKLPDAAQTSGPAERVQLDGAYVRVKSYQPAAHFMRRLVVPEIRLFQ